MGSNYEVVQTGGSWVTLVGTGSLTLVSRLVHSGGSWFHSGMALYSPPHPKLVAETSPWGQSVSTDRSLNQSVSNWSCKPVFWSGLDFSAYQHGTGIEFSKFFFHTRLVLVPHWVPTFKKLSYQFGLDIGFEIHFRLGYGHKIGTRGWYFLRPGPSLRRCMADTSPQSRYFPLSIPSEHFY